MASSETGNTSSRGAVAKAVAPRSFLDPIGFLEEEHDRQTVTFALLRALGRDPHRDSAQADAAAVLTSVTEHMPLHIADEEEDLFPALERHCGGEDGFERMRVQLSKEHTTDDTLVGTLKADLRTLSEGQALADEANFAAKAEAFAELQERHLAWENASVLPLARRRLTKEDLIVIGRNMAARRGIGYPG